MRVKFLDNTPIINADSFYEDLLFEVIKREKVKNIAITGAYGIGKSSILDNFIAKYGPSRVKTISFSNFNFDDDDNSGDGPIRDNNEEKSKKLQAEIVRQLIFGEKPDTLLYSRFSRISPLKSWCTAIIAFFVVLLWSYPNLLNYFNSIHLGVVNDIFVALPLKLPLLLAGASSLILSASAAFLLASLANKVYFKRFSGKSLEVQFKNGDLDFNQNLEEIINYFRVTDYDVLNIEDLDRFNNKQIFSALRQLNRLLNSSKELEGKKITFIYALKDSLIEIVSDRTKFFDAIITPVPFLSQFNALGAFRKSLSDLGVPELDEKLMSFYASTLIEQREINTFSDTIKIYDEKIGKQSWIKDRDKISVAAFLRHNYPAVYEGLLTGMSPLDHIFSRCKQMKRDNLLNATKQIDHARDLSSFLSGNASVVYEEIMDYCKKSLKISDPELIDQSGAVIKVADLDRPTFYEQLRDGNIRVQNPVLPSGSQVLSFSDLVRKNAKRTVDVCKHLEHDLLYYEGQYQKLSETSAWTYLLKLSSDLEQRLYDAKQDDLIPDYKYIKDNYPSSLFDHLTQLAEMGYLDDNFRAYLATHDNALDDNERITMFKLNDVASGNFNPNASITEADAVRISKTLSLADYNSLAYLNVPFVRAILANRIEKISIGELVSIHKDNHKNELFSVLDAYIHYCRSITKLANPPRDDMLVRMLVGALSEVFPNEMIDHFVAPVLEKNIRTPLDNIIASEVMASVSKEANFDLATDFKLSIIKFFTKIVYWLDDNSVINLLQNNDLLIENVREIPSSRGELRDTILKFGLFRISSGNLSLVTTQEQLSNALAKQDLTDDEIASVLGNVVRAPSQTVESFINWILTSKVDSLGVLSGKIADCLASRKYSIPYDNLMTLAKKYNDANLEPMLRAIANSKMGHDELQNILIALGDRYSKLGISGAKLVLLNTPGNRRVEEQLVKAGIIRHTSKKGNFIRATVI